MSSNAAGATAPDQETKRRICRRCKGQPLLVECAHSSQARKAAKAAGFQSAASAGTPSPSYVTSTPFSSFMTSTPLTTQPAPSPLGQQLPQSISTASQPVNPNPHAYLQNQMAHLMAAFGMGAMPMLPTQPNPHLTTPAHPTVSAPPTNAFGVDLSILSEEASVTEISPATTHMQPVIAPTAVTPPSAVPPPADAVPLSVTTVAGATPPSPDAPVTTVAGAAPPSPGAPVTTVAGATPPSLVAPATTLTAPAAQTIQIGAPSAASVASATSTVENLNPRVGEKRPLPKNAPGGRTTKRLFPSGARPIYDWVEGVGRGKRPLAMARTRMLQPRILEQAYASKMYAAWVHDLMTRCESISVRTGCWMYVAVQHPNSKNPFIHYSSPKLRREAPEALESFHKEVSVTMTALVRSDRKAKVEEMINALKQEARAVEAEKKSELMEKELTEARNKVQELQAKLDSLISGKDDDDLYPEEDQADEFTQTDVTPDY